MTTLSPAIGMRATLLRRAFSDVSSSSWSWFGLLVGALLSVGTLLTTLGDEDALATTHALWFIGWIVAPLVVGPSATSLRPESFTQVGLSTTRLTSILLIGSLVGVGAVASAVALLGLFSVSDGTASTVVAAIGVLLEVVLFAVASRVVAVGFGMLAATHAGAAVSGAGAGILIAFSAQGWALIAAVSPDDVTGAVGNVAKVIPSGWALIAVEAMNADQLGIALLMLEGLVVIIGLLFLGWVAMLKITITRRPPLPRPRRIMLARSIRATAIAKEARSYTRDVARTDRLAFSIAFAISFTAMPLAIGWDGLLPWTGVLFVLMAITTLVNSYGNEGTAVWLLVSIPGSARVDVFARQAMFLQVLAPIALALTAAGFLWTGIPSPLPEVIAALVASIGAGAGIVIFLSTHAAVSLAPDDDATRLGAGSARSLPVMYLAIALALLPTATAAFLAFWWGWWGLIPAAVIGVGVLTLLGLRAAHRLESDGPEILLALRSGRTHAKGVGRARNFSRANQLRITLSASLGVIALLPQSIVPAMFLISGSSERVWFYALYLTPGWRWPAILLNATVGLGALAYALYVYRSARHAQTQANRSESG